MVSRNLEEAREAYKEKNIEATIEAHKKTSLKAQENHNQEQGQYIKSLIYGGLDGIITTFAVVAGVAGAALSPSVVLILGFANLVGDGLSMAIGDYLSTKAETEYKEAERKREAWEVEHYPEGEKQELMELYIEKGIAEEDAKIVTEIFSKNKEAWIDIMMVEELGIIEENESPVKNALVTFFSFGIFGLIPLIAYVFSKFIPSINSEGNMFFLSCILTALTLFILGALKVKITGKNWIRSGLEMLIVGGLAAGAAYLIGALFSGLA
ncbi:VIT1/CCC1 transporter family protein [Clostridium sp. CX1]|uniref:VIT1/CCC1 transporter family protein n=1 Tax=Clostridium tanneri TaxID=3037988 RepID=A0ABU4JTA3_9CLOT|nr:MULTISPECIES: VIT1/CCC1 transporter family protein [unclassified Clostridium]MCT8975374.1 VIT1/CCC1 transporter family protein [Clostridium sp. CX1]MDW8801395.1 VIT1/CCC1 transporter family protein [Clostridium sp. A1-XYC3]